MQTITNINELKANLTRFEFYLSEGNSEEKEFARNLVKAGKCFVSYKMNKKWRFIPSRFAGYVDNTLEKHKNYQYKDGRETNPAINVIASNKLSQSDLLEENYLKYCISLGIEPHNNLKRKYWLFDL